jgi:hypothetical protein
MGRRRIDRGNRDSSGRGGAPWWALALFTASAFLAPAGAQLPGAPVLQNAWASPGTVAAVNVGGGSDGGAYAVAGSWAPKSGSYELSGGFGSRHLSGAGSRTVYGFRLAVPFGGNTGAFGFAAFVGAGGGSVSTNAADSAASTSDVPVGVAVGWRRALGSNRGVSVYVSPSYVFLSGGRERGNLVRGAVGIDVAITPSFGLTAGIDFGQTRAHDIGGPSGALFGVGLAYAFARR